MTEKQRQRATKVEKHTLEHVAVQGPDLQNILRQSYDYLTIMPKLRSTHDRRLIQKNILRRTQGFSQVGLQFTCKIEISLQYSQENS